MLTNIYIVSLYYVSKVDVWTIRCGKVLYMKLTWPNTMLFTQGTGLNKIILRGFISYERNLESNLAVYCKKIYLKFKKILNGRLEWADNYLKIYPRNRALQIFILYEFLICKFSNKN